MNLKKNELDFEKIVSERIILKEEIIFSYEKEPKSEIVHEIIYVEILQCYILLFKSFENICNNEDIAKEKKTNSIEYQNIIKILGYKEKELLNIIINLCQYSEDLAYTIRVYATNTMAFIKDKTKEEHEKKLKEKWEENDEGRGQLALKSRKKFLVIAKNIKKEKLNENELKILNEERQRRTANEIDHIGEENEGKNNKN